MSSRELTPGELTFQSFRHSQGSIYSQLKIFQYMRERYGIEADLRPIGPELQRYQSYVSGTGRHTHIRFGPTAPSGDASKGTYKAFRDIRKNWNKGPRYNKPTHTEITRSLAHAILNTESRILDQDTPWTNYRTGKSLGRKERLAQRISSGKSSYLYIHGRDGKTTGQPEFDQLYSDVWDCIATAAASPKRYPTLCDEFQIHRYAVFDAEIAHLGKTVLSYETPKLNAH